MWFEWEQNLFNIIGGPIILTFLSILVCCLFKSYCDRWPGVKLPCVFQTQPQAETGVGSSSSLPSVSAAAAQTRGVNGFQGRAGSQQSTQGGCWAEPEKNLRQRQSSEEINQCIDFPFFVCPCTHSLGDSTNSSHCCHRERQSSSWSWIATSFFSSLSIRHGDIVSHSVWLLDSSISCISASCWSPRLYLRDDAKTLCAHFSCSCQPHDMKWRSWSNLLTFYDTL